MLKRFALLACASALLPIWAHAADKLVPIDAFVELQQFSLPRLSPDGKHIAVNVRIQRGDRQIPTMTVYSLPDLKVVSVIALPGYEIPLDFNWITNTRLIVEKGLELGLRERPQSTGEVVAVNLDGSKPEYLYGYKGFKQSSRGDRYGDDYGTGDVLQIPQSRNGHIFLGAYEWEGKSSMLYDINASTSIRTLIAHIPAKHLSFVMQHDNKPRFATGSDDDNYHVLYRADDASGEWRKVDLALLDTGLFPFAFTPDDSAFFAYHSVDRGPYSVVREDLASGKRITVAQDRLASIDKIEFTAAPRIPFAVVLDAGIPSARYLDATLPDAKLHKTLSGLFPDSYVHFINFTDDGQQLLFAVQSDRDPGSFYLFDKRLGKAELLFSNMPQIDSDQMAERRPIRYTARDGMELTGYLTMPKSAAKKKLPMVLLPHGGPIDISDKWFFDEDAQFLASRGYAVLQVNYRGSDGRGVAFKEAGYLEWGGKMMDDLIDGVKWANTQPEIDAKRVCVYGISFGAYAALMLPVREPSMFKCSAGNSGLYDLRSSYNRDEISGNTKAVNYMIKTMGPNTADLDKMSPVYLADKIKIPVLMAHGGKDKRTEPGQAKAMRDALIKAGNAPEWIFVENEDHGFYDSEHRKNFYQKLEAFLNKHIGQETH